MEVETPALVGRFALFEIVQIGALAHVVNLWTMETLCGEKWDPVVSAGLLFSGMKCVPCEKEMIDAGWL